MSALTSRRQEYYSMHRRQGANDLCTAGSKARVLLKHDDIEIVM